MIDAAFAWTEYAFESGDTKRPEAPPLLVEEGRKAGHTFSQPDLIIAATALHHVLTVVSRDRSDFARARIPVLDPWSDAWHAGP
jgi:predicted nucleic acid-binding protein